MRRGRFVFIGILVAVILLMALGFAMSLRSSVPTELPIPVPNAFDSYIAAGKAVVGRPDEGDFDKVETEVLRAFVAENAESLAQLDEAAKQECVAVVDYEAFAADQLETEYERVSHAKTGQLLVMADGILSERDGDFVSAGDKYIKMLDAGHRFANGGLLAHLQMARAFEQLGLRRLEKLGPEMDSTQKSQLAARLQAKVRATHPIDEFMKREAYLSKEQYGWLIQVTSMNGMRKAATAQYEAEDAAVLAMYDKVIASLKE